MPTRPKALVSWSSGKDSAYALDLVRQARELEVVGLLTTVSSEFDRVAMHGVRHELLRRQAASLALPLHVVELPRPCPNEIYEQRMGAFIEQARRDGVERVVFGDLFLEDIRAYREKQLAGTGIEPVFPLWDKGRDTRALASEMLSAGVVATLTCVDPRKLPPELAGRRWDALLVGELPEGVDPCGEHGEFHTFVSDGPGFSEAIAVAPGEVVEREGFVFADLLPC
ncbi:ATP-binding region [Enhygromyxa salina]|uniref:ATP-binding region n=1 Tax=Enhygromyxa salina TaxID=215803 RepID=A0A2S9XGT4_9BACT|nr:ATP-binding protein [Enhygromyxa salina]PRP92065.1 ATP-binding region [Enhygromyxa salina]